MRAVPVAMILGVCLVATASSPLTASDGRDGRDGRDDGRPYLALGDSVSFGFLPLPGFEAVNASNFVGYADYVGQAQGLTTVNGSCPGEASGSFLDPFEPDNGCFEFRFDPASLPARVPRFPLHAAYGGTQEDFAVDFIKANPRTRLVTIQLGANDLFLLADRCLSVGLPPQICFDSGLTPTLLNIEQNVLTVIASLRAAGYQRQIVIVNYYPLEDPQFTDVIRALNLALADAAARGGAILADAFTPFERAAMTPFAGKNPCRAGLLKANPLSDPASPTCDVHPSQSGHRLIANAILKALRSADHDN